jgi:hypothetical protein
MTPHRIGRHLAAAALTFVAVIALFGALPAAASPAPGRVVFVVVPEARWATLPSALAGWAKANLALNSISRRPIDVYLTMAKGRRTGGLATAGLGPLDPHGGGVTVRHWTRFEQHDRALRYGGRLGELGHLLEDHGVSVAVVGLSADVAAIAADHEGRVERFVLGDPDRAVEALGQARLVIVESDLVHVEHLVQITAGSCRVVASGSSPDDDPHLGAVATSPECGLGRAGLVSPSTRQPGFVTLPDLAPTLLSLVGVEPPNTFEGGLVRPAHPTTRRRLIDEDRRSRVARDTGKPITTLFLLAAVVGLVGLVRERVRLPIAAVLLGMPSALLLMMLLPWWRYGSLAGMVTLVALAMMLAVVTLVAVRRDPVMTVLVLTTVTSALIAVDGVRGGALELDAPAVNNAIAGGRFAGIGNVPYGFLAGASIAACAMVLNHHRRTAVVAAAGVGLVFTVVADGAPMFGADVGGVLATVPAVGVGFLAWRGRLGWRALAGCAGAAMCALAGMAAVELSRPAEQRTHLGRTLTGGSLLQTVLRRSLTALDSLRTSPWLLVAVAAVIGVAAARHRIPPDAAPRAGAAAMGVAALLGTALNDSGVAVGGAVLFVAWAVALALAPPQPWPRPSGPGRPPRRSASRAMSWQPYGDCGYDTLRTRIGST